MTGTSHTVVPQTLEFYFLSFFLRFYSFIHRDRERERQRHKQREKQASHREPDVRLDPGSPGSPWAAGGAKPLCHRGCLNHIFFIHHLSMDTEAPSTVWLLRTLLLETSGCRCPGVSLHLYLGVNPQQCNCWVLGQVYFLLFEEPPHSFPEWLHNFTFPPTV